MNKLLKWIYKLGVMHERQRIALLIASHREAKPDSGLYGDSKFDRERFHSDLAVWTEATRALDKMTEPTVLVKETWRSPFDGDGDA